MLRLTVSTTSTNASFFLYLTSPLRQLVEPVACVVILEDSSYNHMGLSTMLVVIDVDLTAAMFDDTILSVVIYVFRVSVSLF